MTEEKCVDNYSADEKRREILLLRIKKIKQQYPELTARKYKELAASQNWPSYSSLLRGTGKKWSELFPKISNDKKMNVAALVQDIKKEYPDITLQQYSKLAYLKNWPHSNTIQNHMQKRWSELFPKKPKYSRSEIVYLVKEINEQYPGISYQEYQRLASQKKLISPSTMLRYTGKKWRELFPKEKKF